MPASDRPLFAFLPDDRAGRFLNAYPNSVTWFRERGCLVGALEGTAADHLGPTVIWSTSPWRCGWNPGWTTPTAPRPERSTPRSRSWVRTSRSTATKEEEYLLPAALHAGELFVTRSTARQRAEAHLHRDQDDDG